MKIEINQKWLSKIVKGTFYKKNNELNEALQNTYNYLEEAENLYEIYLIRHLRLHPLKGKLKNHFAVDVDKISGQRIIFKCLNGEVEKAFNSFPNPQAMKTITDIQIIDICDYH